MRSLAPRLFVLSLLSSVTLAAGCRFGGGEAEAPVDGAGVDSVMGDAGDTTDAADCSPGVDGDGDGVTDCDELADGKPFTDPANFNGLHAIIGDRPDSGTCDDLDDYAEMETRFATPVQERDVRAGWHFDTDANSYNDPSFGFDPNWTDAESGRFSVRFRGQIYLTAGEHCFRVDIGATGTNIFNGHNTCGQVYVGVGGLPAAALAETGYKAASVEAASACITAPADGGYPFDIVLWLWEVNLYNAKLNVLHCAGAACTPTAPITATELQAAR